MRAFLIAAAAFFTLAAPASAVSPNLVISQVYGGGGNSGAPYTNDYIEIFNRGETAASLSGKSLQYASATGTGNLGANAGQLTPLPDMTVEPGQYVLVHEAGGANGAPLPANDVPDDSPIAMAAGAGKVALVDGTASLGCNGGSAPCDAAALARIVDLVGYGNANFFEGAGAAPGLSNTTAALRAAGGAQDTDNNSADFAAGTPNPRNSGATGDARPTVTDTDPANNQSEVALDASISLQFSEPVAVAADAVSVSCSASGAHPGTVSGAGDTYTFDPATDFVRNESCTVTVAAGGVTDADTDDPPDTMAANFTFSFNTLGIAGLRIHDIQGAHHRSPYTGDLVSQVPGIITGATSNGFWIQDDRPDRDEKTSEGVFVFTGSGTNPQVPIGSSALVSGRITEFRPDAIDGNNLTITEIGSPTWTTGAPGSVSPTLIGLGGRIAPIFVIDDDAVGGNAEDPATPFDPREDGLDFHESLEGMLVRFNAPLVVGPTNGFGELPITGDLGLLAFPHTLRGGLFVRPGDFNPERFILDGEARFPTPDANVRDRLSNVTAIGHYSFGNFKYMVTSTPTVKSGGLKREVTDTPKKDELAAASMNVENLDPTDPPEKFEALARILVTNMKSPDLVAVEEVQDNNGAAAGDTDASATYAAFIAAIQAVGGPTYQFRQINPAPGNRDGGEPNGNIRVGFLFRTDRGLSFVDRPGGDATTPVAVVDTPGGAELSISPGRIDPANPAFEFSRKPLAGEFLWKGRRLFAVANHFNSKGGDEPLFGRFQPPTRGTEVQRHQQANAVAGFVEDLLAVDKHANVIVLGDLNDFEFSETLDILEDSGLTNLMETLPPWERYSYVFDGNSQTLDQILVSKALMSPKPEYDSVHVNAEFHDQASDHDPQVARLEVTGRRR